MKGLVLVLIFALTAASCAEDTTGQDAVNKQHEVAGAAAASKAAAATPSAVGATPTPAQKQVELTVELSWQNGTPNGTQLCARMSTNPPTASTFRVMLVGPGGPQNVDGTLAADGTGIARFTISQPGSYTATTILPNGVANQTQISVTQAQGPKPCQ